MRPALLNPSLGTGALTVLDLHGRVTARIHSGLKPIRKLFGSYDAALVEAVDA